MINLLMVDDDALFRVQFRGMVDWEQAGFRIAAEARNGREAIEEIERMKPDIILTDISMPVMDGIGLIEYVKRYHPEIPVVALSAYDDFDYVRASLKNGAQDYLLKTDIRTESLLALLNTIAARTPSATWKQASDRRDIEAFYFLALAGWFPSADALNARAEILGIALPNQAAEIIRIMPDRLFILYPASTSSWPAAPYRESLRLAADNVRRFLGESVSFGVGDLSAALTDLPSRYRQASARLEAARFLGGRGMIADSDAPDEPQAAFAMGISEAQEIASLLRGGDAVLMEKALGALFGRLEREGCAASDLTFVYAELIHTLLQVSRENEIEARSDDIPALESFEQIDNLRAWFFKRFSAVQGAIRAREGRNYSEYTCAAIQYMRKNYSNRISLRDIAAHLNLNACYLSRLFKEDTGENLTAWLNTLRLDEAERLLKIRDLSIREIAERVGIGNYNHFFTLFRESRGVTPAEYRKNLHDFL
jgi:two-component system response regulator YesN